MLGRAVDRTGIDDLQPRFRPPVARCLSTFQPVNVSTWNNATQTHLDHERTLLRTLLTMARSAAQSGKPAKAAIIVPEIETGTTYAGLVGAIGELLERERAKIATAANTALVETYWRTGRYIVEYEQSGSDRAKYGSSLLAVLSRDLTRLYGKGFNRSNLQYMRKLYRHFPKCTTLSCKLSWSHYLEILKCPVRHAGHHEPHLRQPIPVVSSRQRAIAAGTRHRHRGRVLPPPPRVAAPRRRQQELRPPVAKCLSTFQLFNLSTFQLGITPPRAPTHNLTL